MNALVLVFLGAGLGGAARHLVNLGCARACGTAFPFGTLAVNIVGSLLMGLLAGWLALRSGIAWSQNLKLFLATGVLGGFTTFSAFSLDAISLIERGDWALASFYVLASVMLSILSLGLGLAMMRGLA
jgi:fluoride exporter